MTTTSTLTDRYVDAILRRLPARQRPDIERELRASIAEAVDDRVDGGKGRAEAECAVLTELGDPVQLAAAYADRPLQLIGPSLYVDYVRLLAALVATVLPSVAVAVGVVQALRGDTALTVVGDTASVTLTVGVHLAFWTTLLFATMERLPALRALPARPWSPAAIPEPPTRRVSYGEMIAATVLLGLFTTFVLLAPMASTELDARGEPIGVLSPWLSESGVVFVFVAFATASLGATVATRYVPWNVPLAITRALVDAVCPTLLIWFALSDRVLNPAFVEVAAWPSSAPRWIASAVVLIAVGALIRTVVELVGGFWRRAWMTPDWKTLVRTVVEGLSHVSRR
jgi:hypothetical protein